MVRVWIRQLCLIVVWLLAAAGCAPAPEVSESPSPVVVDSDGEAASSTGSVPRLVFLGDSVTAGLSLDEAQAFPARVESLLEEKGLAVDVVNAGVSGDTSAGGLRRLSWLLRQEPDLLILELGANDGLRGLDLAVTEENLRQIVTRAREAGSRVLLLGMMIPPNYGPEYATGFQEIYSRLADQQGISSMPFLLEGVAADPELNLPDGIHPNAAGHRIIAENLLPYLEPLVRELGP